MKHGLQRSDYFVRDFALQHRWYLDNAGERVAARFLTAVQTTLAQLAENPELGRRRGFPHPALQSIRSLRVTPPFDTHLIFYRPNGADLSLERLLHGRRDLPRRLTEPPA